MSILKEWNKLPVAKQRQLCSLYKIKNYGVTEEALEADLIEKLPKGLLVPEEVPVEAKKEPVTPLEEKEVKVPKKAKKKSKKK